MNCPTCGAAATKNGHDRITKSQQYRCKGNPAHSWSESTGRSAGRPAIGERPLTGAERARRWREREKAS